MPVVPNLIERLVFLQLNQGPALMLDYLGAMAFRAAIVGMKLGVFRALRDGPRAPAEIAHQIGAHERGTQLLLEALEALGYLKKQNGRYANTAMTTKWVPVLADGANFFEWEVFERWNHLETAVREGKPAPDRQHEAAFQKDYQAGMMAVARLITDEIVAKVKLPATARRLLDVGGGHGLHSIKFAGRYPRLSATVFDLPEALAVTREVIAAEHMDGRVSVQGGDFWLDDLGSGYDVALLFNVVHMHLPDENTELLRKIAGALNPGGLLVIADQIPGGVASPTAKAAARLTALNLFIGTGGQTYPFAEIRRWFTAVGFTNARRIRLWRTPGFGLAVGTRAA